MATAKTTTRDVSNEVAFLTRALDLMGIEVPIRM